MNREEEAMKSRREKAGLWLANPNITDKELLRDQKEHPEKWVEYYKKSASALWEECKALDADLAKKKTELKEKETELQNEKLSLSINRLEHIESLNKQTRDLSRCAAIIALLTVAVSIIRTLR